MTPAASEALHAIYEAAQLLAEHDLPREATRLRYHARVLEAELQAPAIPGVNGVIGLWARVRTPDGVGVVSEIIAGSPPRYYAHFLWGLGGPYSPDQLKPIASDTP